MGKGTCPGGLHDNEMLREESLGHHGCQRDFKKIKKGDE